VSLLLVGKFEVSLSRLIELEHKEKELVKAKRLIRLLRAEKTERIEKKKCDIESYVRTKEYFKGDKKAQYAVILLARRLHLI
jgi:hypothetical protein